MQKSLLDALVLIPPGVYINVYFIGDGPLLEDCIAYSNSLSLPDSITIYFTGYTPNPEEYLMSSHVSCLLSLREGLPVSLIESLHSSCALISTNVGATSELCSSSNGLLLDKVDVQQVSNFLVSLYSNPEILSSMMKCSSRLSNNYTLESMCLGYAQLYDS